MIRNNHLIYQHENKSYFCHCGSCNGIFHGLL
ncbi:MAG TPA: hypothetical protein IAB87_02230 [Candidatus Coprenecus merdipullorum]|nr:hypothetical protein [Candidatus Coprenecus merdipullorum]